jgi:hypothetical protein
LLALSAGAPIRLSVDPCAERRIDPAELRAALALELASAEVTVTGTAAEGPFLALRCGPSAEALELSFGSRTRSIQLAGVRPEDRIRVVALFAAESVHAEMPPPVAAASVAPPPGEPRSSSSSSEVRSASAAIVSAPIERPSDLILSLRAELALTAPPSSKAAALSATLEQPEGALFGRLSARVGLNVFGLDADRTQSLGLGLRAGVGMPLARVGAVRLEGELTGGGGLYGIGARSVSGYAEVRSAVFARWAIGPALEAQVLGSVAWLQPGGFTMGLAGGIGLEL